MWILQGAPLALQLLVGMSRWEVPGELRGGRREMGLFIPLAALLLGHEGAVAQFYERPQRLPDSLSHSYSYSLAWVPVTTTFPYLFRPMNY